MDQIVLVQLSDLHLTDHPFNRRFTERNPGYFGHDYELCKLLPRSLIRVRDRVGLPEDEPLHVLVSGDLTQCGGDAQFTTAKSLLEGSVADPRDPNRTFGLGLPKANRTISGNHDQWEGRLPERWIPGPPGYSPSRYAKVFPWPPPTDQAKAAGKRCTRTPLVFMSSEQTFDLHLFGLDSSSGLTDADANPFAAGSISDEELDAFERAAAESREQQRRDGTYIVRAVMVHHGLSKFDLMKLVRDPRHPDPLPLDEISARSLADRCRRKNVSAVLTGHLHTFDLLDHEGTPGAPFIEARSAAAAAGPIYTDLLAIKAGVPRQGFWVHQISRRDRETVLWNCIPYGWTDEGFLPISGVEANPALSRALSFTIRVG
jgi:3',5'-cyclic AMP phosphodiesterase CpdA